MIHKKCHCFDWQIEYLLIADTVCFWYLCTDKLTFHTFYFVLLVKF